jgi:periplasmic divalent cation tolerance protein
MSSDFCLALVTVPNETLATSLAQSLLAAQLAACINCFAVRSLYTWNGKLQQDYEYQLMIKTQVHLFDALAEMVTTLHPYDVPEIIAIPIIAGATPYLNWLGENTKSTNANAG